MHASAIQSITIKASEVDSALLNDADELQKMLRNVTELASLHHLESVTHQFSPQGVSAAVLLSESHIAIHTWPESGVVYVAMTTCKVLDDDKLQQIKELIARLLDTEKIIMKEMAL